MNDTNIVSIVSDIPKTSIISNIFYSIKNNRPTLYLAGAVIIQILVFLFD